MNMRLDCDIAERVWSVSLPASTQWHNLVSRLHARHIRRVDV